MLISVVITSYNYEKYLKDTINSVLSQIYSDWEMIVVDDASTDSSVEIIKEFAKNDSRIKLIENDTNQGLARTLKKGIEAASGEWISILESDDMLREDYLEKKASIAANNPAIGLIFNDVELFGDESRIEEVSKKFERSAKCLTKKNYPRNIFKDLIFFNRVLTLSTIMVKKENILKSNWNTPSDKLLDWWILLHFARENEFYYIPEKLTKWRIHYGSYINKRTKLFTVPVNLLALIDIAKSEKDFSLIPYILAVILTNFNRTRIACIQLLKKALGIPLRCEKS